MRASSVDPFPCHDPAGPETAPAPCHDPGRPAAPLWPGLEELRDLTGLAGEGRAIAHRMNVRIREAEARAYEAYLDAHLEGARRCRTPDELRAYGRPASPAAGLERGASFAETRELDIGGVYGRRVHAWTKASGALADRILRLERRPVPLDVFFDAAVTARLDVGGRSFAGTLAARGGAAPEIGAGPVSLKPGRVDAKVDAGVATVKASFEGGRLSAVEVSAQAVPGVRAYAKQSRGAVEEGIAVGGKLGGNGGAPALRVEARASVGVTLLTQEVVARALSTRSWWDGGK